MIRLVLQSPLGSVELEATTPDEDAAARENQTGRHTMGDKLLNAVNGLLPIVLTALLERLIGTQAEVAPRFDAADASPTGTTATPRRAPARPRPAAANGKREGEATVKEAETLERLALFFADACDRQHLHLHGSEHRSNRCEPLWSWLDCNSAAIVRGLAFACSTGLDLLPEEEQREACASLQSSLLMLDSQLRQHAASCASLSGPWTAYIGCTSAHHTGLYAPNSPDLLATLVLNLWQEGPAVTLITDRSGSPAMVGRLLQRWKAAIEVGHSRYGLSREAVSWSEAEAD